MPNNSDTDKLFTLISVINDATKFQERLEQFTNASHFAQRQMLEVENARGQIKTEREALREDVQRNAQERERLTSLERRLTERDQNITARDQQNARERERLASVERELADRDQGITARETGLRDIWTRLKAVMDEPAANGSAAG